MSERSSEQKAPPIHDNSLYRRLVVRPLARKLAPSLFKLGLTGNGVCWLKLAPGLAGAFMLASRSPAVCFLGMLLLQINFFLDAADGEVARLRGEAHLLSGEYLDKLFDHLPKTAMYFFWGYGAFRLTGNPVALFCGAFFAAWNIYPRFCGVETLLERLDKAPEVHGNPQFHDAVANSFSIKKGRGEVDLLLTILIHPAMNLLTLFFFLEILYPVIHVGGHSYYTRLVLLSVFTLMGVANFIRKGLRFYRILKFK